jgi:hypothetical protein
LLDLGDTDRWPAMGGSTSISAAVTNKAIPALKSFNNLNGMLHSYTVVFVDINIPTYT